MSEDKRQVHKVPDKGGQPSQSLNMYSAKNVLKNLFRLKLYSLCVCVAANLCPKCMTMQIVHCTVQTVHM